VTILSIGFWASRNTFSLLIGIITVLGSSIALMNIMIVSVTERTREIGVRKALELKDLLLLFSFYRNFTHRQLGGIVGIILGILIGYGIATALSFAFVIPWVAILAAFNQFHGSHRFWFISSNQSRLSGSNRSLTI
jgi:ABC-type antimicrobial peptide transport system permease subunit